MTDTEKNKFKAVKIADKKTVLDILKQRDQEAEAKKRSKFSEYELQAIDFLNENNLSLTITFECKGFHFPDDKEKRNIYNFELKNNETGKSYTGRFGDSINNTEKHKKPSQYDVLSCLTSSDPGSFEDFCMNYGYDEDSRKAESIYFAVQKEFSGICKVLNHSEELLQQLQEIN